jgi:RimJ/RimL family protein N-acetyltransferase
VATENAASCRVMEKLGMRVKEHSSFNKQDTDITYASSIYTLEGGDEPRPAQ